MSPDERDELRGHHRARVRDLLILGVTAALILLALYVIFGS